MRERRLELLRLSAPPSQDGVATITPLSQVILMNREFLLLDQLGVGPTSVRHAEIVSMETLISCATRVYLSTGVSIVVSEDQCWILKQIKFLVEDQ